MPRNSLLEAAVVIGPRAWLPFLRAYHLIHSPNAPLDFTLSRLFHQVVRLASV